MENFAGDLNMLEILENSNPSNIFLAESILQHIEDKSVNLITVDRLTSTNTILKSLSNKLPDKTVLIADCQTDGRGRLNKNFYSPNGTGLYMSVLIRKSFPYDDALLITPLVAVAVLDVVKKYADNAKIKWVNDIYIDDKKVCGILTESSFDNETKLTDYVVIGIGLNVNRPIANFPDELFNIATALSDSFSEVDYNLLAARLINSLLSRLNDFNISDIANIYASNSYLDGKKVKVINQTSSYPATVLGIDDKIRLIVKNENGDVLTLSSGEVSTTPI